MHDLSYESAPIRVRDDIAEAHGRAWKRIAGPGTWWTGKERVAIAAEVRNAMKCDLCRQRKEALSPNAVCSKIASLGVPSSLASRLTGHPALLRHLGAGLSSGHPFLAGFQALSATQRQQLLRKAMRNRRITQAISGDPAEAFRLSGLPFDALSGSYGGVTTLRYSFRLTRLATTLGDGVYAGISFESGNLWQTSSEARMNDLRYAGSLFAGIDTVLGPVYLAYGFAEGGDDAFYLFVGRGF